MTSWTLEKILKRLVLIIPISLVFNFLFSIIFTDLKQVLLQLGTGINTSKVLMFLLIFIGLILLIRVFLQRTRSGEKFRHKLSRSWHDFQHLYDLMIKQGKIVFLQNIILAGVQWIARYSVIMLIMMGLGYDIPFFSAMVYQWLIFLLMHLVPTPGASGGAEGMFLLFYSHIIPADSIGIVLIGWRFIDYYLLGIASILILAIEKYIFHINLNQTS